jgi:hypothetical protein
VEEPAELGRGNEGGIAAAVDADVNDALVADGANGGIGADSG